MTTFIKAPKKSERQTSIFKYRLAVQKNITENIFFRKAENSMDMVTVLHVNVEMLCFAIYGVYRLIIELLRFLQVL